MEPRKKLLMIAFQFAPWNEIGAVRPTKLTKYLSRDWGYDVTVLCCTPPKGQTDQTRLDDLKYASKIIWIKLDSPWNTIKACIRKVLGAKKHSIGWNMPDTVSMEAEDHSAKHWLKKQLRKGNEWLNQRQEAVLQRRMEKALDKLPDKFDVVFSTYMPLVDIAVGDRYKEKHKDTIWIADFRDSLYAIDYLYNGKKLSYLDLEADIGKRADCMTGVSHGAFLNKDTKYEVLRNAFDGEDFQAAGTVEPIWNDGKFHIVYTGVLFLRRRADLMFSALRKLSDDGQIDLDNIQVDYAGSSPSMMIEMAGQYSLEGIVVDHGKVDHMTALRMQMSAQLLLFLNWNNDQTIGAISGKLYEYLDSGRPILGIVSGDRANSVMREMITSCGCGYCYEEADPEGYDGMRRYIKAQYDNYLRTGDTIWEGSREKVEQYSYKSVTKQLHELIEKIEQTRAAG